MADALAYLMMQFPAEQPTMMNSMSLTPIQGQTSAIELTFSSNLDPIEFEAVMYKSENPVLQTTFQAHRMRTILPKKRTRKDAGFSERPDISERINKQARTAATVTAATATATATAVAAVSVRRETEVYKIVARCQLVTSKNKTDTYYALDKEENVLFVKGPYINDSTIQSYINIQKEKEKLGLPWVEGIECVWLVPDQWPEGTALGVRNQLKDRMTTAYPFMVMPTAIDISGLTVRTISSKLWPPTEVVNSAAGQHVNAVHAPMTEQEWLDYLHAIAFRVKFQIGDLSDRNFMKVKGRVLSIDESYIQTPVHLVNVLQKTKYAKVMEKAKALQSQLMEWALPIFEKEWQKQESATVEEAAATTVEEAAATATVTATATAATATAATATEVEVPLILADRGRMCTKFRSETTYDGYTMSVVKSAIQKYIRRGNEEKAVLCARGIDRFAEMEGGERLRTNLFHRLQIIYLEDIGHGNPLVFPFLNTWIKNVMRERKNPNRDRAQERKWLELIVRNLCRSRKTRSCSYMNGICQFDQLSPAQQDAAIADIPELVQVREACRKLQGMEKDALLAELDIALTQPVNAIVSILCVRRLVHAAEWKALDALLIKRLGPAHIQGIWGWKPDLLKLKEGYMLYMYPLGSFLFCGTGVEYTGPELQVSLDCAVFSEAFPEAWPDTPLVIDEDFVFDKHVGFANRRHASISYFAEESSKVVPEIFLMPDMYKAFYTWFKTHTVPA